MDEESRLQPKDTIGARLDYSAMAELFVGGGRRATRHVITYRRFARAADAIRFAVEELLAAKLADTILEVDESRFGCREIRELYDCAAYPLRRSAPAKGLAVKVLSTTARPRQKAQHQSPLARYRARLARLSV